MASIDLVTPRLRLRQWRDSDIEPFEVMSNDREVMAHFPSTLSRDVVETMVQRQRDFIAEKGYGFWAVEELATGAFIGFCGLKDVAFDVPWLPAIETGWRFAREHWGKGYATEAGRAAQQYAFETLGVPEIVAFLLPMNERSAQVCERLGMTRDPSRDFDHPLIADGTISIGGFPQRRHILYSLKRDHWRK
ncbi:MAG TPA: GNAT family N-acetyltransferase [Kofleriaceae bacterium]|jgi:RimJ/RimL family protein N-acetyltransferase|nr:GNAT family N-acetyltransferase [Kofleriaceae bacterium]